MDQSEGSPDFVAGVAMLSICAADGCTTIVFGRGTCVEHDLRAAEEEVAPDTAVRALTPAEARTTD